MPTPIDPIFADKLGYLIGKAGGELTIPRIAEILNKAGYPQAGVAFTEGAHRATTTEHREVHLPPLFYEAMIKLHPDGDVELPDGEIVHVVKDPNAVLLVKNGEGGA